MFLLFDGRAKTGDTDDASLLDTADTEEAVAVANESWRGHDCVWFQFDHDGCGNLSNPRQRNDLAPRSP